jgi:hypothetical protein
VDKDGKQVKYKIKNVKIKLKIFFFIKISLSYINERFSRRNDKKYVAELNQN